jgi:hypothetical protein
LLARPTQDSYTPLLWCMHSLEFRCAAYSVANTLFDFSFTAPRRTVKFQQFVHSI